MFGCNETEMPNIEINVDGLLLYGNVCGHANVIATQWKKPTSCINTLRDYIHQ